ncbi:MAG: anthranilate phosphoribosyltransferase [Gammaproteobacteria bacterium]|nr:anthranilate phosphoribosyltransferase [Gammaproteobacteria bacterium]
MFKVSLGKLTRREELSAAEITEFAENMRDGVITDVQIAGFLVGLLMKGPTVDEIVAIARVMRANGVRINPQVSGNLTDMCGTGGGLRTFNVSTANAILTAAAGVPVAKHGSRSISGPSGSADAFEALGITIEITPQQAQRLIEEVGISFLFASAFHSLMFKVFGPEQELGIKTIFFTIIGPLINPAAAARHLLGVHQPHLVDVMAEVVALMPMDHAIIAHGLDGLDEISIIGATKYAEVKHGQITKHEITPEDYGFKRATAEDVKGGDPQYNAGVIRGIFEGRDRGPRRDFLVLNNGFALYVAGVAASPEEGMRMAGENIDSGAASRKLAQYAAASQQFGRGDRAAVGAA